MYGSKSGERVSCSLIYKGWVSHFIDRFRDVSSLPSIIPYGGFSPVRLEEEVSVSQMQPSPSVPWLKCDPHIHHGPSRFTVLKTFPPLTACLSDVATVFTPKRVSPAYAYSFRDTSRLR